MQDKESRIPKDWFAKGKKDLERVKVRIRNRDYEDAAFHLQQAIEKYLKGYLLSKGWELKRVHDLEFLLDEAVKHNPELEHFRETCQEVTGYYLVDRYPVPEEAPKKEDLKAALLKAKKLIKILKTKK